MRGQRELIAIHLGSVIAIIRNRRRNPTRTATGAVTVRDLDKQRLKVGSSDC